jgi:hypothetical protein
MTIEQRLQAFQQALEQLQVKHGVTLKADLQAEQLGQALLTRPVLQAVPIDGWHPPDGTGGSDDD